MSSTSNNEEHRLLGSTQRSNATIVQNGQNGKSATSLNGGTGEEKERFLNGNEPVRLTPAWEENNLTNDELNMKSMTMDRVKMELDPPKDRYKLIFLTLVLHGLGTLIPWNMFITAKAYFVEYKLGEEYTGMKSDYASNFLAYLGIAAQIPNVLFNWLNIFIEVGGDLTTRIVWSIVAMVAIFIMTIVLAMVDSSNWPGAFFWITMLTVIALNMANGIYQNTIYGIAAKLPFKYTGAVVLGSNISGCFTAVLSIVSDVLFTGSARTAAIYYFITALFILLICFDTYFALPLNKFYRYHEMLQEKNAEKSRSANQKTKSRPPYWKIFKQASPQLFNIFFIFFVTLSVFPTVYSDIKRADVDFIIPERFFVAITCFLTFNLFAMLGSLTTSWITWPKPKNMIYFVLLRAIFIPLFLVCRYYPKGVDRIMPVYIESDWAYWIIAMLMSYTSGYLSSLGMMYAPQSVEPQYASTAGMFGAAMLITGIFTGIMFSWSFPSIVANVSW